MLAHLHVKNLALIEEIEVEFGPGLNILTGETGAGKSILLGSMQLILGAKTSKNMIRENAPYALVELLFQIENEKAKEAFHAVQTVMVDGLDDEFGLVTANMTEQAFAQAAAQFDVAGRIRFDKTTI